MLPLCLASRPYLISSNRQGRTWVTRRKYSTPIMPDLINMINQTLQKAESKPEPEALPPVEKKRRRKTEDQSTASTIAKGHVDMTTNKIWNGKAWLPICATPHCKAAAKEDSAYCRTHQNAREKKEKCSVEGCTSGAVKAGLCYRHSPKLPCAVPGCTNAAAVKSKLGYCHKHRHGPNTKCTVEGCHKPTLDGKYCITHKPRKKCSVEFCNNYALIKGVCTKHGAPRKKCSVEGCNNGAINQGLCKSHGAVIPIKTCSVPNCNKRGLCIHHAPRTLCKFPGCWKIGQRSGYCDEHYGRNSTLRKYLTSLFRGLFGLASMPRNHTRYEEILGCNIPFFQKYIVEQCDPLMTRRTYGLGSEANPPKPGEARWEIDYIKPFALYFIEKETRRRILTAQGVSPEEIEKQERKKESEFYHYTNFKPIWTHENRRKKEYWTILKDRKEAAEKEAELVEQEYARRREQAQLGNNLTGDQSKTEQE